MVSKILSKSEYYELHRSPHVVWNTLRSYTPQEWRELKRRHDTEWSVRIRSAASSPHTRFNLSVSDVESYLKMLQSQGLRLRDLYIGPCAPDTHVTLQAEVRRSHHGYEMLASVRSGTNMRKSIPHLATTLTGLRARMHLESYMDPTSKDCLDWILEKYSDSVVEFSCYEKSVGSLGLNTLFWEIRNY